MRNLPAILFLSGASGAGKTTILELIERRNSNQDYVFLHYDSMGIPTFEEMIEQAGSLERWQEIATHRWIEEIAKSYGRDQVVVIEGQSNLDFVEEACKQAGIEKYEMVLLDCDWETMKERLTRNRQQPELLSEDMRNWAEYLRKQAQRKGIRIIDTTAQPPERTAEIIESGILPKLREAA